MNDIRAKFEEIWPAPDCIIWSEKWGEYMPIEKGMPANRVADEWDARLDTFTRCQETTDVYVGLIQEMIYRIDNEGYGHAEWHHRAKQILGREK
jgi:hypothetical protein